VIASGLLAMSIAAGAGPGFAYTVDPPAAGRPRVVLAPRDAPRSALVVAFTAGSVDDDDAAGLTRLTQRALLEANRPAYEQLSLALYRANATLQVETGFRECSFTLSAPGDHLEHLAATLLPMIFAPRFDPAAFAASVERTRSDQRDPGRPDANVALLASTVISDARYKNEPYGDAGAIETLGLSDVRAHAARALAPANATVVFAGRFDPARARRLVARYAGGERRGAERIPLELPLETSVGSRSEIHVYGWSVPLAHERDAAALHLLADLLERRVERRVRALGIAYSATAVQWHAELDHLLFLSVPVRQGEEQTAVPVLTGAITALRDETPPPEEVERSRAAVRERLRALDANPVLLAEALAAPGGTARHARGVLAALETLSGAELRDLAAAWLSDASRVHVHFSQAAPPRILEAPPAPPPAPRRRR
jgi:predicted Zn-dependent peptidase